MSTAVISSGTLYEPSNYPSPTQGTRMAPPPFLADPTPQTNNEVDQGDDAEKKKKKKKKGMRHVRKSVDQK
ncbi:hypothetical protein [Absidia glauca]|jgi:hypothetical protein|uniref:Uncharacterized protein n=1 Tax=Absidia glauca TaxID=4829 RepID=A0A168LKI6_ABSGL|nr:hypothetical protein [Absidia glauca]